MIDPNQLPPFLQKLAKFGIYPYWPLGSTVYKYTSYETALKIIENATLKFSDPSEFNDPFEMTPSLIDTTFRKSDLREWFDRFPQFSKNKRKELFNTHHKTPDEISEAFNKSFDLIKSETGICCFSKSSEKTLMWSHYAKNHSGVCLGFNISPFNDGEFFMLCVNYLDKIIPVNYFKEKEAVLFYWIFSKSKIWQYEEEVRAVYTNQNGYIKFDKSTLKEIYFGLRMPESHLNNLNDALEKFNYTIEKKFVMQIDPATFDLKKVLF